MQRDVLLLTEMIEAAGQAQELTSGVTAVSWKPTASAATRERVLAAVGQST